MFPLLPIVGIATVSGYRRKLCFCCCFERLSYLLLVLICGFFLLKPAGEMHYFEQHIRRQVCIMFRLLGG